jgi:hypothetical protein
MKIHLTTDQWIGLMLLTSQGAVVLLPVEIDGKDDLQDFKYLQFLKRTWEKKMEVK